VLKWSCCLCVVLCAFVEASCARVSAQEAPEQAVPVDPEPDQAEPPAAKSGKKKKDRKPSTNVALKPELIETNSPMVADPEADPSAPTGDPFGGHGSGLRVGFLQFRFLGQIRYGRTFSADSKNASASYRVAENDLARDGDGVRLNRFFVRLAADPLPYLQLKTIIDLAEFVHDNADSAVKQAFVELKPIPKHVEVTVGLFKLPFSILELDPTAEFPFAEFGQADDLVRDLGYAGRDIGAELMVAPLAKAKLLRFAFGAFRGEAKNESNAVVGSIGGRIESTPIKGLRFGVDWVEHPQSIHLRNALETSNKDVMLNPSDPLYPRSEAYSAGRAFSADVQYRRHHLRVAVEGMLGDRTDVDTRYGARSFYAVWGLAGYRFKAATVHWMPAVRAMLWDADREHAVGLRRELAIALNIDFTDNVRLVLDLTRIDVQAGSALLDQPKPLQATPYSQLDGTRMIAQLQVVL
jgi:hypothetical protein